MSNIINIDYHITDYCNLGCVSCGHFCSLVPKEYSKGKSLEQITKDLTLLKSVVGDRLDNLNITGGECTTHPLFRQVLLIACDLFAPKLTIYTNGTLYKKLIENADIIRSYDVKILMSDYNQSWYQQAVNMLGNTFGDKFEWISRRENGIVWFISQFLSKDNSVADKDIFNCDARTQCLQLVDGKLYPCQYIAYFKYFDEYFKGMHNLKVSPEEGFIQLNNSVTVDQILDFMSHVKIDLCTHCIDCQKNYKLVPWRKSSKDINEWYRS